MKQEVIKRKSYEITFSTLLELRESASVVVKGDGEYVSKVMIEGDDTWLYIEVPPYKEKPITIVPITLKDEG